MNAPDPLPATSTGIPDGFRAVRVGGQFVSHNGPLYARIQGDRVQLGFRVEKRHTNPLNICHGGMLATFADMLIPCAAMYQPMDERRFLPTISLQIDYMGSAPLGSWVQGEGEVLRTTRNMLFGQALVSADGAPALRVSGIFKLGALITGRDTRDPLGLLDQVV
jgi:uncharacterized protein (TIGR00369 family)